MKKFVPYEKLSKKERRAIDQKKRGVWNEICPVTRVSKNKKAYDRKRSRSFDEQKLRDFIFCYDIP
ncbi:MAG: hypothetical protein IKD89_04020 [Clostridia bacterium]|nr:hypothetical protein [Clostridia bacterium]